MASDNGQKDQAASPQNAEAELIALPIAAAIAYFHVTGEERRVQGAASLAELLPLVAIALSTLARLRIRRGDLDKAMVLLKEARIAFGRTT